MSTLLVLLVCIVMVEVATRMPFAPAIRGIARSSHRSLAVVRSRSISDHWKERALRAYSLRTLLSTLRLAGLLLALLALAAALTLLADALVVGFQAFLLGWRGLLLSAIFASAYVWGRHRGIGARL